MSQSMHTASNQTIARALSKMPEFTVSELEIIKEALFSRKPNEHTLIAKIWQAQRAIIKAEIKKARNN